jgi:hypothetical protein
MDLDIAVTRELMFEVRLSKGDEDDNEGRIHSLQDRA